MKLFIASALCMALTPLSGAQTTPAKATQNATQTAHVKPKQDALPQTTLDFKPVGDGLEIPSNTEVISSPFCSADGTLYLDAVMLPSHDRQIIAVSPKGKLSGHSLARVPGLTIAYIKGIDAMGPNVYAWVVAEKTETLLNHDVSTTDGASQARYFIVGFEGQLSAPKIIPLDLPFEPIRFAALDDNTFVFLGLEPTNLTPVLAVVDGSGQLEHYIDAYYAFGKDESIVAHALPWIKGGGSVKLPEDKALQMALSDAQFVHYRNSLLLLIPGADSKVFTISSDGGFESTKLHLPAGLEPDSLIASDRTGWSAP